MAGHMISIYLNEQGHNVTGFARKESPYVKTIVGDAKDTKLLKKVIDEGQYDTVINAIGVLNRFAEENHENAVFLNSYLPQYLAKITEGTKIQIIHMSTDCVYCGDRGGYREHDFPDGKLFYDRSKALGEIDDGKNVTFRNSIVGPDPNPNGIGLVNWFLQQHERVKGYKNAIWTGQTTLQLAKTMENASIQRIHGLYNMVPECSISKYDLLILFNKYLRNDSIEIVGEENFKIDKSLIRTNFEMFSYKIPEYEQQIIELGEWMRQHRELYPHYNL
jgi:dTDP-4-dehydrorhamnose reductase